MPITNPSLCGYVFLKGMYNDDYYPKELVSKGQKILEGLCQRLDSEKPLDLSGLYQLTHALTEQFNDLANEFDKAGSEFETVARDVTAADFAFIAKAYGFDADIEELVATRDW